MIPWAGYVATILVQPLSSRWTVRLRFGESSPRWRIIGKREVFVEELTWTSRGRRVIAKEVDDEKTKGIAAAVENRLAGRPARSTARSIRTSIDRRGRPTCTTCTGLELGRPPGRPTGKHPTLCWAPGRPTGRPVEGVSRPPGRPTSGCGLRLQVWKPVCI